MEFPEKIHEFIKSRHVMSLAVLYEGNPWAANCFYVFNENNIDFIIVTDEKTKHGSAFLTNGKVAGTISSDSRSVVNIKGIQFSGIVKKISRKEQAEIRKIFISRFPFVILSGISFWVIIPEYMKMTDNRQIFASKIYWKRN